MQPLGVTIVTLMQLLATAGSTGNSDANAVEQHTSRHADEGLLLRASRWCVRNAVVLAQLAIVCGD